MNLIDRQEIKAGAHSALERCPADYRKIVLLHSLAAIGASAVLSLVNWLLDQGIGGTGGLSGMGLRGTLTAIQSFLSLALMVVLPFWQIGLLNTSIRVVRGQDVSFSMLTRGFRRLGPVLRLNLIRVFLYFMIGIGCVNVSSVLSSFVPYSPALQEAILAVEDLLLTDPMAAIEQIPAELLMEAMLPTLIISLLLYGGVLVWLTYRIRLADYILMDREPVGAMASLRISLMLTRGSRWDLFKLDVSLWWYYGAQLLLTVLAEGAMLLPLVNIQIPFLVVDGLYILGSLALTWFAGAYVEAVYAKTYDILREGNTPPPAPEIQA